MTAKDGTERRDGRLPGRLAPNRFHEAAWIVGPPENLDIADDRRTLCGGELDHAPTRIGRQVSVGVRP